MSIPPASKVRKDPVLLIYYTEGEIYIVGVYSTIKEVIQYASLDKRRYAEEI